MDHTLTLVPSTGADLTPDTPIGWSYDPHPSSLELFTDAGSLGHVLLGGLLIQFGATPALIGSLMYIGYQLSQLTEPMARTASEIIELGIGMALGTLLRRKQ